MFVINVTDINKKVLLQAPKAFLENTCISECIFRYLRPKKSLKDSYRTKS